MSSSTVSAVLDTAIVFTLQQHLVNVREMSKSSEVPPMLIIGKTGQLTSAVKIYKSEAVSRCVGAFGAREYPKLPERNYLVACVDRFLDVQVIAVYSLEQMEQLEDQRKSCSVNDLKWKVLEISKSLEDELLIEVATEITKEGQNTIFAACSML